MVARRDEHGIGLDRHPISIAQMTCRIRFRTVSVLRPSLGAQPTQRRWSHIPNCERAGVGRFARPMCRRAEHMVEDQRALNGLLFGTYLATRLRREEWTTKTTSND